MFSYCTYCHCWLELAKFSFGSLAFRCRDCAWWSRLREIYGLSLVDYMTLLARQGGCCGICGKTWARTGFVVDHDHACCPTQRTCGKCVRGVLCHRCNVHVGFMEHGKPHSVARDLYRSLTMYLQRPYAQVA